MSAFTDLLPALSDEEYAALKADIAERGVEVPIVVDESGVIIDGAHRDRAARELGIDCPRIVKSGLGDDGKKGLALALNLRRRHLTAEQRRPLVQRLRDLGWSTRAIAREAGVSHTTVVNDLSGGKFFTPAEGPPAERDPAGTAPSVPAFTPRPTPAGTVVNLTPTAPVIQPASAQEPPAVRGLDGKKYPARRRTTQPDATDIRREGMHQIRVEAANTHELLVAALRATRRIEPHRFHDAIGRRAKVKDNLTELREWIVQALAPDAEGANRAPGAATNTEDT